MLDYLIHTRDANLDIIRLGTRNCYFPVFTCQQCRFVMQKSNPQFRIYCLVELDEQQSSSNGNGVDENDNSSSLVIRNALMRSREEYLKEYAMSMIPDDDNTKVKNMINNGHHMNLINALLSDETNASKDNNSNNKSRNSSSDSESLDIKSNFHIPHCHFHKI